jgi:transcriptional regulator with XRE-family HTH domain
MSGESIDHLLKRLRALRERRGLTQEEFAEKSGISYKYYQSVEAGRKRDLRISTIDRLAKAHGLAGWQLLLPPEQRESSGQTGADAKPGMEGGMGEQRGKRTGES